MDLEGLANARLDVVTGMLSDTDFLKLLTRRGRGLREKERERERNRERLGKVRQNLRWHFHCTHNDMQVQPDAVGAFD